MRHKMAVTVAAVILATLLAPSAASARSAPAPVYYVSVGDSAAAGVQPPGFTALGYANQLLLRGRLHHPRLRLVKLGCPGETTATLISGIDSPCSYASGSQLNEAASVLRAHPGRIAFITIDVGVNDVLNVCLDEDTLALDPVCTEGELPQALANLTTIIRTLRDAAPGTPIAGMSYWNPFLGLWVTGPDGELLARTANDAMQALNAGLVSTYRNGGALVADVAGPGYFNIADFTPVRSRWGRVPANVANACRWTWFCHRPPLGPDPHPTTWGYGVVADAFAAALGEV